MKFRSKLFQVSDPFDTEGTDSLFAEAVQENCRFQYENCPEYRKILDYYGFSWSEIQSCEDLSHLPFLPTMLFKSHRLLSFPENRRLLWVTSSGTKGKFSRIPFDAGSLLCGLRMVWKIAAWRGLLSPVPVNYIVLGYQPHRDNHTGVAKTAFGATLFTPALSRTYALQYYNGRYTVDLQGVISAVEKHSRSHFPVRFMGFPAYAWFLLKSMEEQGRKVKLPKGSKLMLGGGWKQFYTQQVEKEVFYALAENILGIADTDIVEFFGAVEHPVLYCDCKNHHFHVPAYSRVIIRDVHTLKPVEYGTLGLVNLITPMVKAAPLVSVMTDDLGILREGSHCGCGIHSPYLEIVGRIGLKEIKTCAAGAAEFLSRMDF